MFNLYGVLEITSNANCSTDSENLKLLCCLLNILEEEKTLYNAQLKNDSQTMLVFTFFNFYN